MVMIEIKNKQIFDTLLQGIGIKPVVLYFSSPKCTICKTTTTPLITSLEKKYNNILFASIDTSDRNLKSLTEIYKVQMLPTIIILKKQNGSILGNTLVGTNTQFLESKLLESIKI